MIHALTGCRRAVGHYHRHHAGPVAIDAGVFPFVGLFTDGSTGPLWEVGGVSFELNVDCPDPVTPALEAAEPAALAETGPASPTLLALAGLGLLTVGGALMSRRMYARRTA